MARQRPQREQRIVELDIESIGFEGRAVGRLDGVVHFVKGALPGEHVTARVIRSKRSFVEAELVEVLTASPHRLDPPCPHFGTCGGCSWQHLDYTEQASWKRQHVVDSFERLAKIPVGTIHPTLAGENIYGYRNKMEFSFGASAWLTKEEIDSGVEFTTDFALGLHVPGRFDKVRSIDHCLLQSDIGNTILAFTHRLRERHPVRAYHQRAHQGFLRHLTIRTSATNGAVMTMLITAEPNAEEQRFVDEWMTVINELPAGSTVVHAVNATRSPVANGEIKRMEGAGFLVESSLDVDYRISPFSFFQTNTHHLPQLVQRALEAAHLTDADSARDKVVWDLYCGTGTLTLPAARLARQVIGAELVQSSIDDAHANAERNGISNVDLHVVDLHGKGAIDTLKTFARPNVILIDPPRAGMHPTLVDHVREVGADRISYVSCNPATLARDCALLHDAYEVEEVTPVDMFPQTFHVEAVAALKKR
jgi:23S rRNA (uracil1939-C5)-methyltransferase